MATFENESLGTKFDLPEKITVRQQMAYRGRVYSGASYTEDVFLRHWFGAVGLLQNWESVVLPDPTELDIDNETDPQIADVIMWAGNAVASHMLALERVEKN